MKTRQELILDFMLALASSFYAGAENSPTDSEEVYDLAALLADEYLERM
jgi:hypothetical protein